MFYYCAAVKLHGSAKFLKVFDIVNSKRESYERFRDVGDETQDLFEQMGPLEDAWVNIAP